MAEVDPLVDTGPFTPPHPDVGRARRSIYQELQVLIERRGWAQGGSGGGRLSLDAAIDELLGTRSGDPATGPALARAARIARHLRELSGASSLASWNDDIDRRVTDVFELLAIAGRAHPAD
jgi:hypothetical protein